MPVATRLKPFDRTLLFKPAGALSESAGATLVAKFAREEIAKAKRINDDAAGRDVAYDTFVNDVASDRFEDVKPGKAIVARFDLSDDLVRFCFEEAKAFAPVLTGQFRSSITIYADGVEVSGPDEARGAAEIVISSTVPYARKIEGDAKRKPLSGDAPAGVFQAVALLASSRFGNLATIRFSYRSIAGAAALEAYSAGRARRQGRQQTDKRRARDTRQPAIVITYR